MYIATGHGIAHAKQHIFPVSVGADCLGSVTGQGPVINSTPIAGICLEFHIEIVVGQGAGITDDHVHLTYFLLKRIFVAQDSIQTIAIALDAFETPVRGYRDPILVEMRQINREIIGARLDAEMS